jgi:hypothetical protein
MPETREHIRDLADLYLTGARQADDPAHPAAARTDVTVEVVFVGHLPVRAGLWLTQYADEVAREAGPTGLLRLDSEQVILEILRGADSSARAAAAATFQEAISAVGPGLNHWIIRPGLDERIGTLLDASPDLFTILTGVDDAAIVAAYRIIKDIHDAAMRMDSPLPAIELSILGADAAAAQRAAANISETAEMHLGIRPRFRRCIRAMGALGSTLHFRFPSEPDISLPALMSNLRALPRERAGGTEKAPMMVGGSAQAECDWPAAGLPRQRVQMLATPIAEVGPGSPAGRGVATGASAPAGANGDFSAEPMRLPPKIEIQVEPKHIAARPVERAAPPASALATWIKGLSLLPVRCPDAPDIEIAADAGGGFHVVAWEDRLRALPIVIAWLRRHRDLVAMACSDYALNAGRPIQSHVMTSEPRLVADLFGAELKLHLLAPVEVEGKTGWYSTALNG